jgi:hypothetical protein
LVEVTIKTNFFWDHAWWKVIFLKLCDGHLQTLEKEEVDYTLFSVVELANIQVNGLSYNEPLFLVLLYGQSQNFNMISSKNVMLPSNIM